MRGAILFAAFVVCVGAETPSWQKGKLIDASTERVFTGTSETPGDVFGGSRAHYAPVRSYLIRASDREYTVSVQPSKYAIRDHAPHVVVNTEIRFRIEKRKFTFLDDDGKEYKGQVEREAAIKP